MAEMMPYWVEFIAVQRRRPNDGLVAALLDAEVEGDEGRPTEGRPTRLTDGEVTGFCSLLGAAGNETVTKLLANAWVLFARHLDEYRKILADPALIPDAVTEVLRYWSPSQYQGRTTTTDVEWYGKMGRTTMVFALRAYQPSARGASTGPPPFRTDGCA